MNHKLIQEYLDLYKQKFETISQKELYKWKAIKRFQDKWNLDSPDFCNMLDESLELTSNLLDSYNYFPKKSILELAVKVPSIIKELFADLFNENKDLIIRINNFKIGTEKIRVKYFPNGKIYQDHRAILVYLSLRFPESHYFYKFKMFKDFSQKIGFSYIPKRGKDDNIGQYYELCEMIQPYIIGDQKIIKLHKQRLTDDCYNDISFNVLTQDFIYAVTIHMLSTEKKTISTFQIFNSIKTFSANIFNQKEFKPSLTPKIINHKSKNAENSRIGKLGEQLVLNYETKKLESLGLTNLIPKVEHTSVTKGDGAGYDILSFNKDGEKIYIEVKTSKNQFQTPFYLTSSELAKSILDGNNFYLYRIYNFSKSNINPDLIIIQGSLVDYCINPILYKISLNENKRP